MPHTAAHAASTAPAIEADTLSVRIRRRPILHELDFTVPAGRITGLLGPSGSGKSTLMRSIVGVQSLWTGSLTVLGQPAGSVPLRHAIGYMTQEASIYRDLTVLDNVKYFGALHGKSAADAREAVGAVGLADLARRRAADLSGGQFSRVSLACALVGDPQLLVLDEPTVGLDPVLRVDLWDRFRALADRGATLLVSSHVMEEAGRCDSLLLLREGRLLAQLTPEALRERGGSRDLEQAFLGIIRADLERQAAGRPLATKEHAA
ncbi:multidrug ABC transporter ATPase [Sinomonas atrocyanea]|uniref:Multidrug ABC transporter ATPase n=1 Tax=Sinomonas atrocyanea TaxID=37927 RepID=A0A126ZYQ6_9MICC|nr:ABC transporter ATP-binding protein [Sinomonas atrocyanea]AMM32318.1 multidrug ABC transporter ATPase [Sinomonas atrocyanea]GEB66176.1 multidrug ABC transporter ATP-binding protein [Sinomonas atrocyanea]GGG79828.1 multidrug ABC transporter ATP-binding protein [Sinomonas atrocyanea]